MKVKVGQMVMRTPVTFDHYDIETNRHSVRPMRGEVKYVHPKGRYHTVEFALLGGKVRESFLGVWEQ